MQSKCTAVCWFVVFLVVVYLVPIRVAGQSGTKSRIAAIDNTKMTTLRGNVHPLARSEFDRGPAPTSLSLDHILLVLQRSPEQQAALETLLAQQQDPSSPNYHKWLTPEQFGQQFGPSTQDIQKITAWLESQGFHVNEVAKGGTVIDFSGTAGQVQQTFHASIHRYVLANGEQHWANSNDPQIPSALAPVVAGIASLNNFQRKRMSHNLGIFRRSKDGKITAVKPQVSFAGGCNGSGTNCYAVGPADFAKIYNVPSTVTGALQTIAIVSDSDVSASDVTAFRTLFGLPAINFQQIETGTDPGIITCANNGDECEAVLDVEWAGAVATGAKIDLVVSPTTNTSFGGDTSALYIINNNLAGIISYSYGACELELGTAGNTFYQMMWSQAASQGITVLVSTGDNGAAGCDAPDPKNVTTAQPATMGLAVNGVGSTPFNVAVGGTDFSDVTNPTTYWNNSNTTGQASAKSYIPEVAYNDSCSNPIFASAVFAGLAGLSTSPESNCNDPQLINFEGSGINLIAPFGGGGGMSNCTTNATTGTTLGSVSSCSGGYAKPSWQTGPGVPNDGKRDTPDVSLFSGDGTLQNFYIVCEADENGDTNTTCNLNSPFLDVQEVGGTSVSAQAFAGIVALIDQQTNSRQGNINPMLYALAAGQAAASCNASATPASTCVFNDVTSGTIAMPCAKNSPNCTVSNSADTIGILSGFNAGVGFDLATGLGSVNVGNLVNKAGPNFYLSSSNPVVTVSSPGASGTMTVNAYPVNGFTGTVNLACSGLPTGATCTFNPSTVVFTSSTSASTGIPITVTVNTTSASVTGPGGHLTFPRPWMFAGMELASLAFLLALLVAGRDNERRWSAALAILAITVLLTIAACGSSGGSGGTNTSNNSTTAGPTGNTTATLTGTGASGSPTSSMSFTVTIQ